MSQHRTKIRLRTPVSQAAALHNCRGPQQPFAFSVHSLCPGTGLCTTPSQAASPSVTEWIRFYAADLRPFLDEVVPHPTLGTRRKMDFLGSEPAQRFRKLTVPGTGFGR